MSKNTKRTLLGFVVAIAALLLIAYLPTETEAMSRAAWQYLGCFVFMLVLIISRAIPDWAAVLCTMAVLVALKVATVAEVTSNFASSTVWLCIGVFIMSIGINNSGFMKRLALWVLTRFPGTYAGQVTAMLLSGVIMSPIIPSSTAKTSMMAPFVNQVCDLQTSWAPTSSAWLSFPVLSMLLLCSASSARAFPGVSGLSAHAYGM